MLSLSVLFGVLSAAAGTWVAGAQGDTAEQGAAVLVLPSTLAQSDAGANAGPGTAEPSETAVPTTTSAAPATTTTSSAPPTTSTSETTTEKPPSTTKTTAPAPSTTAGQVVALVNRERAAAGCKPLAEEAHLTKAAQDYSDDMSARNFFSHTDPEGVTFDRRIKAAGYPKPGAENIAKGQTSAAQVMDAWMHSEGHRANILNCSLTKIGVGVTTKGWYWVQDFGY